MTEEEARRAALDLVARSGEALVGSLGDGGYPWIKAMLKMEAEGLKTVWFSTNTSSKRVAQFRADPRSSVYFVDFAERKGLMLVGEMELLTDPESKERLWRDGYEMYYPLGLDDPDYTVLRFSTQTVNYYHQLANLTFEP